MEYLILLSLVVKSNCFSSPTFKIMGLMKEFNSTSGYYDVFIPALKKLSSSYFEYYQQIEIANEKLLAQYPEIKKMNN